jgi:hypothetical protein
MSNESSLHLTTDTLVDFPVSLPSVLAAINKLHLTTMRGDMIARAKKSLVAINSCN